MFFKDALNVGLNVIKNEGMISFANKTWQYLMRNNTYPIWIKKYESVQEKEEKEGAALEYKPLISVIVPVYNVKTGLLVDCIESVLRQTYKYFELCLVDDCSTYPNVREVLKRYESHPDIKVRYREKNGHIAVATNDGIDICNGEFFGLLDCDDILSPNALMEAVKALNHDNSLDLIYSDEDKITEDGRKRKDPFFKPDWSPDTLLSMMYTSHFSIYRTSLVRSLGGFREETNGCQDYDLALRVTEKTDKIYHINKILYHWRERAESTALKTDSKKYIYENVRRVKNDTLKRRNISGKLNFVSQLNQYQIVFDVVGNPKVSIIIPSKDNYDCLKTCIESIISLSGYKNYEIILVDNGSSDYNKKKYMEICKKYRIKYLYGKNKFNFSRMCNIGAMSATGEYLCFLNDDIEIIDKEWMEVLLGQACNKHAGAVGMKLYYPGGNRLQHTGILNLKAGPVPALSNMRDDAPYYFGRNVMVYNYSSVTGACLMVAREKFDEVKGFDEKLPVAYNDMDLCFSLIEKGYYNSVRPDVKAFHHESVSRGYDKADKKKELQRKKAMKYLYAKHPDFKGYDPCYNSNLIQTRGDFSIGI